MSRQRTDTIETGTEVALAALTCAAVIGFIRLFVGSSYLWPLLGVAIVCHAVAAVTRRRGIPAPLCAALVAVAALCTMTAWRYHGIFIVPTPAVFTQMHRDLTAAAKAFRTVTAPAPARPGFVLTLAALVALVSYGGDSLAFRLRARAEAVVPAAGLFLFGAILGGPRDRLAVTGVFAAAALAFVLLHRTSANRQSTHWIKGDTTRDNRGLLRAGAVILAVTSIVGATVASAAPHHDQSPWTRWRGTSDDGGTRITVSPLVDLKDRLTNESNVLLFKVQADQPAYWRLTALDHFSNDTWSSNNSFSNASGGLDHPDQASKTTTLTQQFSLQDLAQVWAPAAFQATKIRGTDKLLYDADSATLIVRRDQASSDGLNYTITSQIPELTSASLSQGSRALGLSNPQRYLQLPDNLPPVVASTASTIVAEAGASSEYQKALALQNYFRNNFAYTTDVSYASSPSAIAAFLVQRQGWCEQFAGSFAAMARTLGIPSRVAVGFTPGRNDPAAKNTYDVYGRQAHAWPEIWFPTEGWVAFEPTPGRGAPNAVQYTGVPYQQDLGGSGPSPVPQTLTTTQGGGNVGTTTIPTGPSGTTGSSGSVRTGTGNTGAGTHHSSTLSSALFLVLLALAVIAAAIGSLVLTRWWLRARRHRAAHTAAERVAVSWQEACDAVSLVTTPPTPMETRLEYAGRAGSAVPATSQALGTLAGMTTAAVWDDGPPQRETPVEAAEIASRIDQTVREELGPLRHAVATLHPRTLRDLARRR